MFSCCRANSKNSSIKSAKKDKNRKNDETEKNKKDTKNEKKLIIPTINIENSKENESCDGNQITAAANETPQIKDDKEAARVAEKPIKSNAAINQANDAATNDASVNHDDKRDECDEKSLSTDPHDEPKASLSLSASASSSSTSSSSKNAKKFEVENHENSQKIESVDEYAQSFVINEDTEVIVTLAENKNNNRRSMADDHNVNEAPTKSCLSRHNSIHTSIKKKVNISTHAEIIEPEPLPPLPPYDHASLGDDDEVFSDSLPPPKRDSMCAPYIYKDNINGDELSETIAFAHGLPEWFNDERINDTGCIEPPVTPVGRDELEMKRQRLYTDLLRAAQAAVEHSIRFTPLIASEATSASRKSNLNNHNLPTVVNDSRDCDPDLKPSVAENLESLVNRLERLVDRLERSVSARELEIANRTFGTVLEKKRESFDLESAELPPLPIESFSESLNNRIERLETTLSRINDRHSSSRSPSISQNSQFHHLQQQQEQQQLQKEGSLENIPTVLEDYLAEPLPLPPPDMSVIGYQDIMNGPLSQYLSLSNKIGGDVAKHAQLVKQAFDAQLQYVTLATQCAKPSQDKQNELLRPTSNQISAIQDYREKNRASPFFNHLSAISESIPALGWVCVSPTPGPHVKEMNDAGQFYTNRVLKEWKEKNATHVEWARAWVQTLTELQAYIKQYHTTGLVWSGKGSAPAAPMGCPPPPPPPTFDSAMAAMSLDSGAADDRSALFAQINQGEKITQNLKKVSADMQTHKNPTLRSGPAPFKTPTQFGGAAPGAPATAKEPVFARDGKKWLIEYQKNNSKLLVENAEMNNVIYMFRCENSTLTVKGKVNNIVMDSCKKCSLLFDAVVASIEFVNCQSVQMQVLGNVPTIIIDKTDGCQMYLSKDSLGVEIVNSKSSEMNVMLPEPNGDYTELAMPEQYKTTISGKTLKTVCVDSLG